MTYLYHFTASALEGFAICCMLGILKGKYWNIAKILSMIVILAGVATILDKFEIEINLGINLLLISILIKILFKSKVL